MEYRIKKVTMMDGSMYFSPQKKVLFLWFDCIKYYQGGASSSLNYNTIKEAEEWIEQSKNYKKSNTIKSKEII